MNYELCIISLRVQAIQSINWTVSVAIRSKCSLSRGRGEDVRVFVCVAGEWVGGCGGDFRDVWCRGRNVNGYRLVCYEYPSSSVLLTGLISLEVRSISFLNTFLLPKAAHSLNAWMYVLECWKCSNKDISSTDLNHFLCTLFGHGWQAKTHSSIEKGLTFWYFKKSSQKWNTFSWV